MAAQYLASMKKFLICLCPFIITAVAYFALDIASGENYESMGGWFIPLAILLIGVGAILSGIFLGRAVYGRLKGPEGICIAVGALVGLATVPLYIVGSFAGCSLIAPIVSQ